jgi:uncharacterized protein
MKMTQTERLILSLLYRILEKIDPDDAKSYRERQTIVEEGFTTQYSGLHAGMGAELSERVQQEVYEILNMHRALKNGLAALGNGEGIDPKAVKFRGFDGNNEGDHLHFGTFLTEQGLFEESPVVNSHMPVLGVYQRQLDAWRQCKDPHHLTKQDIENILAARVHPDSR